MQLPRPAGQRGSLQNRHLEAVGRDFGPLSSRDECLPTASQPERSRCFQATPAFPRQWSAALLLAPFLPPFLGRLLLSVTTVLLGEPKGFLVMSDVRLIIRPAEEPPREEGKISPPLQTQFKTCRAVTNPQRETQTAPRHVRDVPPSKKVQLRTGTKLIVL